MTAVDHHLAQLRLIDFIPTLSPAFGRPDHLASWCDLIEQAKHQAVRGLCSVPIRHYKSETTIHGVIWLLLQDPSLRIMFLTHSFDAAKKWGKRIRQLAEAVDHVIGTIGTVGPTRGWNEIAEWRNSSGGGVVVMSADQSKIGYDCHVLIVDDPIDEHGAEDFAKREEVDESIIHYSARCMRNGKPGSVLIVASRFHPDDPIGRRLARTAAHWQYIHNAAIEFWCEFGHAAGGDMCPEHAGARVVEKAFAENVWGLDALHQLRAELAEKDPTERFWWAQLQNNPKPTGSDLFGPPTYYETLPAYNFRRGYGADFAYTVGTGSDWCAIVAGRIYGTKMHILEVIRHKIDAHLIEGTCKRLQNAYGYGPIFSYMSGPEVGMARVLNERGVPILHMQARYNKLVRAQRTVKRWNDGDIVVPVETSATWVKGFLHRVACFRGREKDSDDDEIDALVSLCDGIMGGASSTGPKSFGRPYAGLNGRT
jgi:predicted phage terminase large subunit-like protein